MVFAFYVNQLSFGVLRPARCAGSALQLALCASMEVTVLQQMAIQTTRGKSQVKGEAGVVGASQLMEAHLHTANMRQVHAT